MPAPIVRGLINYLSPLLAISQGVATFSVWDGEVPRYDAGGNAIGPTSTQVGSWPAVQLEEQEPGFRRAHTVGTNSVLDEGVITIKVWGLKREDVEDMMDDIEAPMEAQVSIFNDVSIGGPPGNPNYVAECTLSRWGCWQDGNARTSNSSLLYRGEMDFDVKIHSSAPTTS